MTGEIQSECRQEAYEFVDLTAREREVLSVFKPGAELCCFDVGILALMDQLSCRPRMTALAKPVRGLLIPVRKGKHLASGGRNVTYYRMAVK